MPGGRLTAQDRERIATGLADGLGYAEIARGIGRPTSTVSREVARNGGAAGYRPDLAQRATTRRAHRNGGTRPADAGESAEVRSYRERFTEVFANTGLPRMPAAVLCCLLTSESSGLTAAELVERLQVSPASISKAVSYLEILGIRREPGPGRRIRYVIDDDVWFRAWRHNSRSYTSLANIAHEGAELLDASTPGARRLRQMERFLMLIHDYVDEAFQQAHREMFG
jgi:hypothetical protein